MTTIDKWIERHGPSDRVAFRFENTVTSYRRLAQRITIAASSLDRLGVEAGDRVAFCGLNRPETFEILFACARLGAMMVPLNNRLTEAELGAQIGDSDPTVLLATDGFATAVRAVAGQRRVRDLDAAPFVTADGGRAPRGGQEATVLTVYTSGTTGAPKGAMLSQGALAATVANGIDHQGLSAADRVLAPLPTFHVGGLNIQTLPALHVGAEVLLMRRFDPEVVIDLIGDHRPTQAAMVPTMLAAVAASPRFSTTDLSSLRGICSGSSAVPPGIISSYRRRGVPIGQVYGATETGPTAVVLGYDEAADRPGSCGRAALHTELRVVDGRGEDVEPNVTGEIWLRGPNMFSGYWRNREATEAVFRDGWYRTGDVGHLDEDGYCYLSDRLRDVLISGGENIYPAELEAVLSSHPAIEEVAVIAGRDDRWGEVPLAVIVPVDGTSLTIDELRSWCVGRMARYKHPRALLSVESLPRTALGKVQKHRLRESLGVE